MQTANKINTFAWESGFGAAPAIGYHGTMNAFCTDLPKAELHLHLEGSVEPQTLLEIEPSLDAAEVAARYQYQDFLGFLKSYAWITKYLRGPEQYALITKRLLERLRAQNVPYAEINVSAGVILWREQEFGPIYDAIQKAAAGSGVQVYWILDAVRQFGVEAAQRVAELAAERVGDGITGFGIGGDEARGPAELFAEVFQYASAKGLHLVPHAGESMGPESIWAALKLGAERIGHGIRAVDDPDLMEHLRKEDIPLEVCISSNICTGVVKSLQQHPVRRLFDAGVPIVLNSDDPPMFHTTLTREYEIAAAHFGFSEAELRQLAENSFRYAFHYNG
ncbi:MAG: adenosine deaminase [Bryobacteraceae bacterium]